LAGNVPALDISNTENNSEIAARGTGNDIAQNGQGPRLFGDVAGHPILIGYTRVI